LRLKIPKAIHKHAIIASRACSYSVMCHFALRICHLVVQIIETARSRLTFDLSTSSEQASPGRGKPLPQENPTGMFCLLSPVSCLLSPVSCLLSAIQNPKFAAAPALPVLSLSKDALSPCVLCLAPCAFYLLCAAGLAIHHFGLL
jgi:hypothetical protein